MLYLILGGSGSGKSAYAEELVVQIAKEGRRIYLATMEAAGEEGRRRVKRHLALREGKKFHTIEQPRNLSELKNQWEGEETVLLECMSNLTANEMFREHEILQEDAVVKKVTEEVLALKNQVKNLVVVSNNVFEDGIRYDEGTMSYLSALGKINEALAKDADVVTEVVYTVPVTWRKENPLLAQRELC